MGLSFLRPLTGNWQLKLLALALAVLLWVVVSAEQVTSQWILVPLEIRENDPNFQLLLADVPTNVDVRFTGSGRDLADIALRKPPLILTIDQVESTSQEFRLNPSMVQIPGQLTVNAQEVRSPRVQLNFRRLAIRTLAIQPSPEMEIPEEWTLVDSISIQPREVELRGSAERVETADQVRTLPFSLPAADTAFSMIVPLDTSNLRGLDLSVHQVRVSGVVNRIIQRRLSGIPISAIEGVVIQPGQVDVLLTGPRNRVDAIRPGDFRIVTAMDAIPTSIPPEGISVPLRIEQLRTGIRATITPTSTRLMPIPSPVDSAGPSPSAEDSTSVDDQG